MLLRDIRCQTALDLGAKCHRSVSCASCSCDASAQRSRDYDGSRFLSLAQRRAPQPGRGMGLSGFRLDLPVAHIRRRVPDGRYTEPGAVDRDGRDPWRKLFAEAAGQPTGQPRVSLVSARSNHALRDLHAVGASSDRPSRSNRPRPALGSRPGASRCSTLHQHPPLQRHRIAGATGAVVGVGVHGPVSSCLQVLRTGGFTTGCRGSTRGTAPPTHRRAINVHARRGIGSPLPLRDPASAVNLPRALRR